ncbi:espin-like protein [Gastrophryne carolinensis]
MFLQTGERAEEDLSESAFSMDLDTLVPTHDERGHFIPEWKRQVMVRRLQAHLEEETKQGEWKYSRAKSALLGPYGELITEEELNVFDGQMEVLRRRRECQQYEKQLKRQVRQLQALLPTPMVNVSINPELLEQKEDPEWNTCMSSVISSLSNLLSITNGTTNSVNEVVIGRRNRSPARSPIRELLQCGVSVKRLKGQFEKLQPRGRSPVRQHQASKVKNETEDASDSGISSEDSLSLRNSPIPPRTLRKERIVLLFLSHWKRSAYSHLSALRATESTDSQKTVSDKNHSHIDYMNGTPNISQETNDMKNGNNYKPEISRKKHQKTEKAEQCQPVKIRIEGNDFTSQGSIQDNNEIINGSDTVQHEVAPRVGRILEQLFQQRSTVHRLIGSWRSISSPSPHPSVDTPPVQSPEQLLSTSRSQTAINHDSLTLDLFMLGYFRLLEQDLPEEERRMRHLLCFEVFDQLGRHGWPTAREFHCTVLKEIATGRRTWSDGFEDIKVKFFGTSTDQTEIPAKKEIQNPQLSDGNDICQCMERSFSFWKEKEAELFGSDS